MKRRNTPPFVNKYASVIDLVAKRYSIRPSYLMHIDKEYSEYYCFQFDLAIAAKAIYNENAAQKKAYEEAEKKAQEKSGPVEKSIEPSKALENMPKFNPDEMLKKMNKFNLNNIPRNDSKNPNSFDPFK